MWNYYQDRSPGQVQVLGIDLYNGTSPQLNSFKAQTGASYPLFLNGGSTTGGNLFLPYGQWDNYVVINRQGIIRYHAYDLWPHGNRYHLDQIRGCVDSLVANTVGVDPADPPIGLDLRGYPNPTRGGTTVELKVPGGSPAASVRVYDLAGREVARLHDGPVAAGRTRLAWTGRDASGGPASAGVYVVRAVIAGRAIERRIAVVR